MPDSLSILERSFLDTTRKPTREQAVDLRLISTCEGCGYWKENGDLHEAYDEDLDEFVTLCDGCVSDIPSEEYLDDDLD